MEESEEIKEWRRKIQLAHLNKERSLQIKENQTRKLHDIIKDAEEDDDVLKKLEVDQAKSNKNDGIHKLKCFHNKYVIQQQMKDREKQREQSMYEYDRDRKLVNEIVKKIQEEDMNFLENERKKKETARMYMENTYREKNQIKLQRKLDEKLEKEKEREYFEKVAKREGEFKAKKQAIQDEKDKKYEQICEEKKKMEAEREYWEFVRNELSIEDNDRKMKIKELEEKEKKAKQKEAMLASAIEQAKAKEERKKKELEEEAEFKRKLLEKFKEDERLEQYNMIKRKQKEMDYKKEIEKQWTLKLNQYKIQKEYELQMLLKQQEEEKRNRELIEFEKRKLIQENEKILKTFLSKEYQKLKLSS